MPYMGLALYAEGAADYEFLRPLLLRICRDLCCKHFRPDVDFGEVVGIDAPDAERRDQLARADRIAKAVEAAYGASIVFIHADAGGNAAAARRERIDPGREAASRSPLIQPGRVELVAVLPVRETEAWMLVDGNALRRTLGTTLPDESLVPPDGPAAAEAVPDPKQVFRRVVEEAVGRRGKRADPRRYFALLGEEVDLALLRRLTAVRELEEQLHRSLSRLNILR